MESFSILWGIILIIAGILAFFALLSIEAHIRKTNQILRRILHEQNPDRYEIKYNDGKLRDNEKGGRKV